LICKLTGKNKHYWDMDRVCSNYGYSVTNYKKPIDFEVTMSCPPGFEFNKSYTFEEFNKINKEQMKKEKVDYSEKKIPNYYIGKTYGYEARKVCEDFDLSYNVGNSVAYLLRCGKKYEQGMEDIDKHIEDIVKAKNHLDFELDRLNNLKK
tara:strand:- start:347 stop:796 length:450 start_codon:yes stop_codon:yes gene_type:complete